jgi:hypothetical protein
MTGAGGEFCIAVWMRVGGKCLNPERQGVLPGGILRCERKSFLGNEICFAPKREIRFSSAKVPSIARHAGEKRLDLPCERRGRGGKTWEGFAFLRSRLLRDLP